MEFITELLLEIIYGILETLTESNRIPKWLGYTLMFLPLGILVALIIRVILRADDIPTMVILGIIALVLIAIMVIPICSILCCGVLRTARNDDLPEILKMYRSVIGKNGCHWTVAYPNEPTLQEDFQSGNLYVLWRGSKMIGVGSIVANNELDDLDCWHHRKNAGEIARIVIKPEYQSKGFGKHLVKKLCYKLNEKGYNAVHILVSTKNHHALNLYRETKFYCKGECQRYDHSYYAFERKL